MATINSPSGATTVNAVTGDNYAIPLCEGNFPAAPTGFTGNPTEALAQIIRGSETPDPEPDPGDIPVTLKSSSWEIVNAPFTSTTLGVAHQFTIWFKFSASDPMDPPGWTSRFSSFTPAV